jgi:hypothetical protein
MKKYIIILSFFFLNCKLIRLTTAENFISKSNQLKFELDESIRIKVKIDDTEKILMLDTGASNTIILDTTLIKNYSERERLTFLSTKDPNGKLLSFYTPSNIETEMFLFENNLVTVLPITNNICNNNLFDSGILGASFFKKNSDKIYTFDFDNSIIENHKAIPSLVGYNEVKSHFFRNHFSIYLNINGFEEPFIFDTGNNAYPLIIGVNSKIKPISYVTYEGSEGIVASGNLKTDVKYANVNEVNISNFKLNSPIFYVSTEMKKYNNMGIDFIKNFNWIIDFENKKIYFKRNKLEIIEKDIVPKYKYLCMIENEKLNIISVKTGINNYKVGQQIYSVNNKEITTSNICEMQFLLNNNANWDELFVKTE